jgi:Domain of unknown function (DUF4258)
MQIEFHPHALQRMVERGTKQNEVIATVQTGEPFPAKYGRRGFRKTFIFQDVWRGRYFAAKQVEVFVVKEEDCWLVISVLVKYF